MTKPGRIPCDVPGCGRTAPAAKYPPRTRIICARHWRGLTQGERAAFRKWAKERDALADTINARHGSATIEEAGRVDLLDGLLEELWNLAIERAAGI